MKSTDIFGFGRGVHNVVKTVNKGAKFCFTADQVIEGVQFIHE